VFRKKAGVSAYLPEVLGLKISHSNELAAPLGTRPGGEPTWRARGRAPQVLPSRNAGGKARESGLTLRI
jgi:hypothetical protein